MAELTPLQRRQRDGIFAEGGTSAERKIVNSMTSADPQFTKTNKALEDEADTAATQAQDFRAEASAIKDEGNTSFLGELGSATSIITGIGALGALLAGEDEAALGIAAGGLLGTAGKVDTVNKDRRGQRQQAIDNAAVTSSQSLDARKALVVSSGQAESDQMNAAVGMLRLDLTQEQQSRLQTSTQKFTTKERESSESFQTGYMQLVHANTVSLAERAHEMKKEVMALLEDTQIRGDVRSQDFTTKVNAIADRYRKEGVEIDQGFADYMANQGNDWSKEAASAAEQVQLRLMDRMTEDEKRRLEEKYGGNYAEIIVSGTVALDAETQIMVDTQRQFVGEALAGAREGYLASLSEDVRNSIGLRYTDDQAAEADMIAAGRAEYKNTLIGNIRNGIVNNDPDSVKSAFLQMGISDTNEAAMKTIDDAVAMYATGEHDKAMKLMEPLALAGATTVSKGIYFKRRAEGMPIDKAIDGLNWVSNSSEEQMIQIKASENATGRLLRLWSQVTDPDTLENPAIWFSKNARDEEFTALVNTGMRDPLIQHMGTNDHNAMNEKILFQYGQMSADENFSKRGDEKEKMQEAANMVFLLESNARRAIIVKEFVPGIDAAAKDFGAEVYLRTQSNSDQRNSTEVMESLLTNLSVTDLRSPEALRAAQEDIKYKLLTAIEEQDAKSYTALLQQYGGLKRGGIIAVARAFGESVFGSNPFDDAVKSIKKGE